MPNTSQLSGFTTKWRDLENYATQHGLAPAAVNQVYSLDYSRLAGGSSYQLSKAEALDAIQSASQGSPVTQAPPQSFSPGRIPGDIGSDVKGLGVGIFGLIKKGLSDLRHPMNGPHELEALWRDPKVLSDPLSALTSVFTHPGMGSLNSFVYSLTKSPFLSATVPGVGVAANFEPGGAGLAGLWQHPVTNLLDVVPFLSAGGSISRSLARAGLDDQTRAVLDEASKYHPSDFSNQAQAARKAAGEALGSALRRAVATNNHGLVGAAYRSVLESPFAGETFGTWMSRRLTRATRGQLGPAASAVGRLVQTQGRRPEAEGMEAIVGQHENFYERNGLKDPKEVRDFIWIMDPAHFREDWRTAYADMLGPGEVQKIENAQHDYEQLLDTETQKDLARERLGTVTDPRTGRTETRATLGEDGKVITRYNDYLAKSQKADAVLRDLAELTGNDVPRDPAAAAQALVAYLNQAVLEPAKAFLAVDGRDETQVRRQFPPTKPVGADQVDPYDKQAVQDLLARGMKPGNLRWRREEVQRVGRLFGPAGLFPHLAAAVNAGRLTDAERLLGQIEGLMKTTYGKSSPAVSRLLPDVTRARAVLKYALRPATKRTLDALTASRTALERAIDRNPEARWSARNTELVRQGLLRVLDGADVTPRDFALVADQIAAGDWHGDTFEQIITPKEFAKTVNSALQTLNREIAEGKPPVFVYSAKAVDLGRIGRPRAPERISTSRSYKTRGNINPSAIYDPILGLTRKQLDDLHEEVVTNMLLGDQGMKARWGRSYDHARDEAAQFLKLPEDEARRGLALDQWMRKNYARINPTAYISSSLAEATGTAVPADSFLVPIEIKQAFDAQLKAIRGADNFATRAYSGGTRLFRYTLLNFSARYQMHIWGGGSLLLLMRSDPIHMARVLPAAMGMMIQDSSGLLANIRQRGGIFAPVFDWLVNRAQNRGEYGMAPGLSHELPEADPAYLTNDFNWRTGKKASGWLKGAMERRGVRNAGMEFAAFGANMLRSMAYLIGKDKAGGDIDAGLRFALKVFADMDAMTPFERSIIRYFMPFYGWTRHVLQYAFTYPIDHPYRAAVVSQMINQEWQDWNTGIPQSMMYLFQIGGVDTAGNVQAVDLRQLDPLRSVNDVFSMAGFLSDLNPAFQTVLPALGVNPATGGPETLYPTMELNTFYGNEQPTPATLGSVLEAGVTGYIPEASALQTALQMTSYARYQKANNPNGYRQAIAGALGWPWLPQTVSVPQVMARTELDRFNVARDAATAAMNDPNPNSPTWTKLLAYAYVPYQGWMVQPRALRQWAFDTAVHQGLVTGSGRNIVATIAPSNIVTPPYGPTIK